MLLFAQIIGCTFVLLLLINMGFVLRRYKVMGMQGLYLAMNLFLLLWLIPMLVMTWFPRESSTYRLLENISALGEGFMPVILLFLSFRYSHGERALPKMMYLVLLVPLLTQFMVWTDPALGLYYAANFPYYGVYRHFSIPFNALCVFLSFLMLVGFTLYSTGRPTLQTWMLGFACAFPVVVSACHIVGVSWLYPCSTPIAFGFSSLIFLYAMFRFNTLRVTPVAIRTLVDRMQDGYLIVDDKLKLVDYNSAFREHFPKLFPLPAHPTLPALIQKAKTLPFTPEECRIVIRDLFAKNEPFAFRWECVSDTRGSRHYNIEATPVCNQRGTPIGVVLLFKDVNEHEKDLRIIRENQAILLERERMASLGQLIGGIAHNLRTPIMASSGSVEQLRGFVEEYKASIGDDEVTPQDHLEIAADMEEWLGKLQNQLGYMADLIRAVKDRASVMNTDKRQAFTLSQVLSSVDLLLRYELTSTGSKLFTECAAPEDTNIIGDRKDRKSVV